MTIGEPGTQLTMRTFHIGGTASMTAKVPEIVLKNDGIAKFVDVRKVRNDEGKEVVLNKNGTLEIWSKPEEGRSPPRQLPAADGFRAALRRGCVRQEG